MGCILLIPDLGYITSLHSYLYTLEDSSLFSPGHIQLIIHQDP